MNSSSTPYRSFVILCAFLSAAIALLALVGGLTGIRDLASVIPDYPEMRPVTAVGFILFAGALVIRARISAASPARWLTAAMGLFIAVTAAAQLWAYQTGGTLVIDRFLIPDMSAGAGGADNRMSPHSALNFLLIGLGLASLQLRGRWKRVSVVLALAAAATAFAAVLGHLYHADSLYGISEVNGMAVNTAFLFLVVSFAIIALDPECRIVELLLSDSLGGQAARRLLPVVIVVPTVVGWLRTMGQDEGLYDTGFGSAMSIFALVLLMLAIITFYSQTVHDSDIKRRAIDAELTRKEERYRDLFNYSEGMICIHDTDGTIRGVNPAIVRSLGYSEDEIVGRNLAGFLPKDQRKGFDAFVREIENAGLSSGLLPLVAKDGQRVMWRYTSILVDDGGNERYVIGHAQDVTELMAAQKQLESLSLTDELTGLYNRRGFRTLAEQQLRLESNAGTARGLTVIFADLDGLKAINDRFGHEAGSDAIITFAGVLKSAVRGADIVSRWGGDEFVILTIGAEGENSEMVVDRIRERIDEYNVTSSKLFDIACSFGAAPVRMDGTTLDDIVAVADAAMYADKIRRKAQRGTQPFVPPADTQRPDATLS